MTIYSLEKYINNVVIDDAEKKALIALIDAINDWPEVVTDLNDFEMKINIFLNEIPSKESIIRGLRTIDYTNCSWQGESLYQVLEIYNYFDESLSLKNIIDVLEAKNNL